MEEILAWLADNERHILAGNRRTLAILLEKVAAKLDAAKTQKAEAPEPPAEFLYDDEKIVPTGDND